MQRRSDNTWLTVAGFMILILGVMVVSPPARAADLAVAQLPVLTLPTPERVQVKLSVPVQSSHTFISDQVMLVGKGPRDVMIPANTEVTVTSRDGTLRLYAGKTFLRSKEFLLQPLSTTQTLRISSWDRVPAWDDKKVNNDNEFLGMLHLYPDGKKGDQILVVNDIDIENYMRGVAEVPEQDETEKRKALAVVARSYVAHYISGAESKFTDTRYNASDDPEIFQKYLGYGFTKRSPKWQEALKATAGVVLTYKGSVLKAAYSSCTDTTGIRKVPKDIGWGGYFEDTKEVYANTPDPLGVDPDRSKKNQCGHGVGLSGLGATNLAKEGEGFTDILDYYYNAISYARLF